MPRRRKKKIYEEVEILETAAEGKSLAKIEEQVLFVPQTVPGDVVDVQVTKKRRRYMEGRVIKFHKYSDKRIEPFCEHFGVCGGCKWQFLSYEDQLENKARWVKDSLERLAKLENPNIKPILGAPETQFYRNKLEFTFSNSEWLTQEQIESDKEFENRNALGFHIPGRFDKILDIKKCWLQADPSNEIRLWVKEYALKHNLEFFDLREQTGFLRNLIIRTSSTGEIMVIFSLAKEDKEVRENMLNAFVKAFPNITSVMYVINEKKNDTIGDLDIVAYKGPDHIFESMKAFEKSDPSTPLGMTNQKSEIGHLKFKIGPKSFYQTNSAQAENLYRLAVELADIKKDEVVYDLYTGTGTIANYVADQAKKVIGVEYVEAAIEDAKVNSKLNNIDNTVFLAGDMKDVFTEELQAKEGKADVVITDPPRAGMHKDVVEQLLKSGAERIVYISCNPATQARDIELMKSYYDMVVAQPVDMFPHTHHVENVVLLRSKS
ncbi:MAG: 23S rRNA (uracil(1939)-C(5))-methyltransferase RlmD [Flavobacteriales bacterium]|nr:23S rRNA (uracil(1939)-C(5))-methyltransferase RlmD [Flavobacteriales bacterium]|tara:strand:+ start:807 stop:2279 length:1473 start_codon:yes stop_codon:yes gene_type:complete